MESTFLVPSWTFYGDGPEKAELIELAKSKWSQNPCKHLQRFRDCPFGRECVGFDESLERFFFFHYSQELII